MNEDKDRYIEHLVSAVILLVLIAGCFFVLRPFLSALLWAVILSFSTWPIYQWWLQLFKGRRTPAASVMTVLLTTAFVIPLLLIGLSFADDATNLIAGIRNALEKGLPPLPVWVERLPLIGSILLERWQVWTADQTQLVNALKPYLGEARTYILKSTPVLLQALLQVLLSIIVCFFVYRDGEETAQSLANFLRKIAGKRAERLLQVTKDTTKSVVYGVLGTAFVQSTLAGVGFFIANVPGALVLGFLTFFFALVPMGPPFIWIPVTIWLFYNGFVGWGIFMALWGFFVISGIDKFVKPYLISLSGHLPFVLILLGVLGGVIAFGFIGVFLGPTLLALGYSLISEWTSRKDSPAID